MLKNADKVLIIRIIVMTKAIKKTALLGNKNDGCSIFICKLCKCFEESGNKTIIIITDGASF